jgi:nucleoside phosphorylase
LFEGELLFSSSASLARGLIASEQIVIAGERPSQDEFIESRLERYGFDSDRYPMYFGSDRVRLSLQPTFVRPIRTTEFLHDGILAVADHHLSLDQLGAPPADRRRLSTVVPLLKEVVEGRKAEGITRSLFAKRLVDSENEAAASRLISAAYIKQYIDEFECAIASGIRPLASFDHLASARSPDVRVLGKIVGACGFNEQFAMHETRNDELLISARGAPEHQEFVEEVALLSITARFLCSMRDDYSEFFCHVDRFADRRAALPAARTIFQASTQHLRAMVSRARSASQKFSGAYELAMNELLKPRNVLLVTATKTESIALRRTFDNLVGLKEHYLRKVNYTAVELGLIRDLRIIFVQCEPGSVGPSGAQAVISDAIRDFEPEAVILAGIAFGARRDKQAMGDILVSRMVYEYERQKVTPTGEIPRGQRIEASPKLISLFRQGEVAVWDSTETRPSIRFGLIASGEKLVDSKDLVDRLLHQEPELIGGEMEGAGLVAAASRARVPWIVIKAIVDWAHDKGSNSSDDHQINVATGAFAYVLKTLLKVGL